MLKSIYIQNYALIEQLNICFEKGFSVITGETGAGKSIILGAIGLLLGQRADTKSIKNGASKCTIEAQFDIDSYHMEAFFQKHDLEYEPHECIVRRELQASGKSRAFINDSPVSLAILKELGEQLIDIHSQHQNLLLSHEKFQLEILDLLSCNNAEQTAYQKSFTKYQATCKKLKTLREETARNKAEEDYIRFQLEQLDDARLSSNEQEALEQESEMLSHAEEIKSGLYKIEQLIDGDESGILPQLKESLHTLRSIQHVFQPAQDLTNRLESCYIDLKDLLQEANKQEENVAFNPDRLSFINERLNLIYSLEQKHHVQNVNELIEITEQFRKRLLTITLADETISRLEAQLKNEYKDVLEKAAILTSKRQEAAQAVEKEMRPRLIPLGMPNVRFIVELSPRKEPDETGADNVTFLFSANKNGQMQPVASIASGGEIARVMLSLKALISRKTHLPTILFDEIDTGVSGEIADKMGNIMQEMGTHMQVISITHLPQIAAKGKCHYKVFKQDNETETQSNIRLLTPEERIEEIAHMLSGTTLTDAAISNAKELLKQ